MTPVSMAPLHEAAPAKINLTLRVLGKRDDGYHALHSLVAFAQVGDILTLTPNEGAATLSLQGDMASGLSAQDDNLVLRAARYFADTFPDAGSGAFTLTKNLPVASGIGGGSADAAAALRLLARLNGMAANDPRLYGLAEKLGSDVPVCLQPRAQWMTGRGDRLMPLTHFPRLWAVLVNPRVAVSTATVFKAWKNADPNMLEQPDTFDTFESVVAYIKAHPNDLEIPACSLAPVISEVLAALHRQPGCRVARMSGSGATVFGLFSDGEAATQAAHALLQKNPQWWVRDTSINVIVKA